MPPTEKKAVKVKVEDVFACDDCGAGVDQAADLTNTGMGNNVCEECMENYFECEECAAVTHTDSMHELEGDSMCEECYMNNHAQCDECNEEYYSANVTSSRHGVLCDSCHDDNYFECDECGETFSNDDYDDGRCTRCSNGTAAINDAGYMPRLVFHKMPWENTLYQGIELEVDHDEDDSRSKRAEAFTNFLKKNKMGDFIYLKEDGSINNGFEIVSHPFTSQARNAKLNWREILDFLKKNKAKASSNCGMHVHVGRVSADNKNGLTDTDARKLKLFFWYAKEHIERIAGRVANSYCAFEPFDMGRYKGGELTNDHSRYCAVNIVQGQSRKRTVEFRIFASTLEFPKFIGRLQFIDAICEYVKETPPSIIGRKYTWTHFMTYVKKAGKYQHFEKLEKSVEPKKATATVSRVSGQRLYTIA